MVIGNQNDSGKLNNEYSKIRYSTFFIDIDSIKEALGDKHHDIVKIILSLQSDLSRIFDIRNNKNYAEAITILYSLKSSSDIQELHTDYDTNIEIEEKNYPLSCIFALEDNTHFRYLCRSHIYDGLLFEDSINKKKSKKNVSTGSRKKSRHRRFL